MKSSTKYNLKNIAVLFFVMTVFLISLTRFKYYFGSTTDWVNQHWSIPEYFRTLFYDTHELFPSFAFNIGGGQNIYYLAYYGLFSPLILLSYCFPHIPMMNYIITISIVSLYIDCVLFYVWIKKRFNNSLSLVATFIFIFSMPLIFHSHRHIMFVNYFPFLLLALISVDTYFKKHRKVPLIIFSFLIIMTSFYFSVGAFITIMLYAIYVKLESGDSKGTFIYTIKTGCCLFISLVMSGILIIPTLYTILSGRGTANVSIGLKSFIPNLDLSNILFNPYSAGLTAISFFALMIGIFSRKKHIRFLSVAISVFFFFPCMVYLMNGTMYFDAKVLIPFIPLLVLITSGFYKSILKDRLNIKKSLIIIAVSSMLAIVSTLLNISSSQISHKMRMFICIAFLIDAAVISISIFVYKKIRKAYVIFIPIMVLQFTICVLCNFNDRLVKFQDLKFNSESENINEIISDTLKDDNSFYRTGNYIDIHNTVNTVYNEEYYQSTIYSSIHNKHFNDFYFNSIYNENRYRNSVLTTQPQNYLFNIFMSNKYIIDKSFKNHSGYEKVKNYKDFSLYKNDNVLPVGYASEKLMSSSEYNALSYPYNIEALLKYVIVDDCEKSDFQSTIKKADFPSVENSKIDLSKAQNGKIDINLKSSYHCKVNFKEPINNKLILLRFNASNPVYKDDIWININGTLNKLTKADWKYHNGNYTFDYVFEVRESPEAFDIIFSEGIYSISDLTMYEMPLNDIDTLNQTVDEYVIDREKTSGDNIYGTVNAESNEFFVLSVPYDKGFTVMIDGKKCEYQCTDLNFIGFNIPKGFHTVELIYKSPFRKAGFIASLLGLAMLAGIIGTDIFKKRIQ